MAEHYQVVVIGGGPVGMALALDLGLRGISCALIESRTAAHSIPKGQNLTQRTLEHFYFWGIADELRAARLMPRGFPIGEITAYGTLMGDYWHAPAGRELVRPYYFQDNERLPQYRMEAVLAKRLASVGKVAMRSGWTAENVRQGGSGVEISIVEEEGPGRGALSADYVVGCDGARSIVREQAGITRSGTDFDKLMVLTVFRSRELHELLKRFPERSTYRVMHPDFDGYWQFFGRVDVGESFFFHAPVPRATTRTASIFANRSGVPSASILRSRLTMRDSGSCGTRWRRLIAPAASSLPATRPTATRPMAVSDSIMAWRTRSTSVGNSRRCCRAGAAKACSLPLVPSVSRCFATWPRISSPHALPRDASFLKANNPERDSAGFERAWAARQSDLGERVQSYEPNYEGSSVVAGRFDGKSSAHGTHSFAARAGHHLSPQPLSTGRNVFEQLGRGFSLLAFDVGENGVAAFRAAAAARSLPLTVIEDTRREAREAYGASLILVRPDQFVAWSDDKAPADVAGLLRRVTGR